MPPSTDSDVRDKRFVTSMFPLITTQSAIGFDSIERSEAKKIINSHLKMLLLTNPGEVISDINFGVGLYGCLFLNEREPKILNLKTDITIQIKKYLPYLNNFSVKIDKSRLTHNTLAVRIEYSISNELTKDTLDFIVGEGTPVVSFDDGGGTVSSSTIADILAERT